MTQLSLIDAGFLQIETPETPMHVGGLHIYQLPEGGESSFVLELFKRFVSGQDFAPPFHQKLRYPLFKLGIPALVEDQDFDLNYHVRYCQLPQPGSMDQLLALVSNLHESLLDQAYPLWECHLVDGLEGQRFAIYFKMHHCILDGVSGMRILEKCLSESPTIHKLTLPWEFSEHKKKKNRSKPNLPTRFYRMIGFATRQVKVAYELTGALWHTGLQSLKSGDTTLPLPFLCPKTAINQEVTPNRCFAVKTFSLESFKLLGKAAQATVNDIVIGVCAGALHRYLKQINKLPDKPLVALVPVSIRPKDSDAHGNQVSAILCNLGTHVENPVQRLQIIKDSSTEGKAIQNNLSSQAAQNYAMIGSVPILLVQLLSLSTYLSPAFNLVISNIPGPRSPMYMNGARLINIYPISALYKQQNLNITVTSYQDSLDFGLIACRDFLREVNQLAGYLEDALDELNAVFGVTKTI